jgi:carbamate kinase
MDKVVVIAIGGNAILQPGQQGTVEEQLTNIRQSCQPIIRLLTQGYKVVLTHGNGPQVGQVVLRSEAARDIVPPHPLDVCVSETQGSLGYIITQTLGNMMAEIGFSRRIVTVVTQVLVDTSDPAFANPTKPIGPFYSKEEAERLTADGLTMIEDSGRGYRRVVSSPQPCTIIEKDVIRDLVAAGYVVLAAGGGGIPVAQQGSNLAGIEAVIDKDRASALLATEIGASSLVILTGVDHVKINFGQPDEQELEELPVQLAKQYLASGQFPPGSMGPKIEAAISFLEQGGQEAVITSMENLGRALSGETGTRIIL